MAGPNATSPHTHGTDTPAAMTTLLVECIRLVVVGLATVGSYELASSGVLPGPTAESSTLLTLVLGVAVGYVAGGALGRFTLRRIDSAERRLASMSTGKLLAGALGGLGGLALGGLVSWPLWLLGPLRYTLPPAMFVVLVGAATGGRIGVNRGDELFRAVGGGRLQISRPTSEPGLRVLDTSALIDGRILDVVRGGFCDGILVVPRFVLYELQGLADARDDERRRRGRRGLDVLVALQRAPSVTVEVAEHDYPDIADVDAKLVALAKERAGSLVTVDGNLARVAEVQGVRVLNLHLLAEGLRPPVLPADEIVVRVVKRGKEARQGVGYLSDGTMVVVEGAHDRVGFQVTAEVTSVMSTANGRMVFSTRIPELTPLRREETMA